MKFARVLRPIFYQARRGVGEMSEFKPQVKVLTTREEFARHWPKLYAKQEHHIRQLKNGIPVHYSGGSHEVVMNYAIYGFGVAATLVYLYQLYLMAQK